MILRFPPFPVNTSGFYPPLFPAVHPFPVNISTGGTVLYNVAHYTVFRTSATLIMYTPPLGVDIPEPVR